MLGESDGPLTNRELAHGSRSTPATCTSTCACCTAPGLIELAETGGREKPYRPVAKHLKVGPEIRAAGLASELQAAQLRELQRGFELHASNGEFRSAQVHAKLEVETLRTLLNELLESLNELEDDDAPAADDHDRVPPCVRAGRDRLGKRRRGAAAPLDAAPPARACASTSAVSATGTSSRYAVASSNDSTIDSIA